MKKSKQLTTTFCLLSAASIMGGNTLSDAVPYSSIFGYLLTIIFLLCAVVSANKSHPKP